MRGKIQSKKYFIKLGKNIISPLGFEYDYYKTDINELMLWCGWDNIEDIYKYGIENRIINYRILAVNVTYQVEEI